MSISSKLALATVRAVHLLVIVYVIGYPYTLLTKNIYDIIRRDRLIRLLLNVLYLVSCTSILLHWKFNNDACFLTTVEAWIRGKKEHEGFIYSIISPIYKFPKNGLRQTVRVAMFVNMAVVVLDVLKEFMSTTDSAIVFD